MADVFDLALDFDAGFSGFASEVRFGCLSPRDVEAHDERDFVAHPFRRAVGDEGVARIAGGGSRVRATSAEQACSRCAPCRLRRTNTFQSPKLATSDGLAGSSFAPDLDAGLEALVAATAGGRRAIATQSAAARDPNGAKGRKGKTRHHEHPLNRARPYGSPGGGLPCRPIRAKFRPSALPADAGAAILHLVTEK